MSDSQQPKLVETVITNMTDFEKSVYNDICSWAKSTFGIQANIEEHFYHFRELYWKEYLNSQKNVKIKNV